MPSYQIQRITQKNKTKQKNKQTVEIKKKKDSVSDPAL